MARKPNRSLGLLLIALTAGSTVGQVKVEVPNVEVDKKRRQQLELAAEIQRSLVRHTEQLRRLKTKGLQLRGPRLVKPKLDPKHFGPGVVLPQGWPSSLNRPSNPILTGDYREALVGFDRTLLQLYRLSDPEQARRTLGKSERELLAVRKALFEIERAEKKNGDGKATTVSLHGHATSIGVPAIQAGTHLLQIQLRGANLGDFAQVNGHWVAIAGNELVRGDYRRALDELQAARRKLDTIADPRAARRALDTLDRRLLDAQRVLWEREQARK